MSDVRLTATNPVDSSVVPVACNAQGELLVEGPLNPDEFVKKSGDTMTGTLNVGPSAIDSNGNATFIGKVTGRSSTSSGNIVFAANFNSTDKTHILANGSLKIGGNLSANGNIYFDAGSGTGTFTGNVSAPNINTFREVLLSAVSGAESLEELRNAIISSLTHLDPNT